MISFLCVVLLSAASGNHVDAVRWLIEQGARADVLDAAQVCGCGRGRGWSGERTSVCVCVCVCVSVCLCVCLRDELMIGPAHRTHRCKRL